MEENKNIYKIVVTSNDELTDIVRGIHKSDAEKIILTFTEPSDILISPINLKVVAETAERESKLLIAQIIQNPTGVRNSKLAGIKVIETPTNPTDQEWQEAIEMNTKPSKKELEKAKSQEPVEEEVKKSAFEEKVNNIILNSKEYKKKEEVVKEEDFPIIIDNDLQAQQPFETPKPQLEESLTGRDFASVPQTEQPKPIRTKSSPAFITKIKTATGNIDYKKYLKLLPKFLIPFLAILILGALAYYKFVPFVKVRIFVEAKSVELEKTFTGDPNIQEIDFDNLKIPIKTESVEKGLSENITATGKAYKGEKAKGTIRITYTKQGNCTEDTPKVNLNAGQTVTTQTYSYKLTGSAQLTCDSMTDVNVEAADIGQEYNIPANKFFSVPGYPSDEVFGLNSAAFTGGSKTEYTVLSKQDVDSGVDSFSTTAIEEVKSELREKGSGWDIIENSIKSEVDEESIKTDIPIGGEATTVNLQLNIKGTATYYLTKDLTEGLTTLLRTEANEQNLFESADNLNLTLGDDIEKELSVDETTVDSVKIKLVAKATVKPDVNKTEIESTLKGMKWEQGLEYLSKLSYAAQPTEIEFNPSTFPDFIKYFPSKQGGVLISVVELKTNND
jgi:hypothetical protein